MMKQARAVTKYQRIPPRKARLVADLIRGKKVADALAQLNFGMSKASRLLKKTLTSAVANAEMNHDARSEKLFVAQVHVDEGPRLKRAKAGGRGSRAPILKRMSHFTVVVSEEI